MRKHVIVHGERLFGCLACHVLVDAWGLMILRRAVLEIAVALHKHFRAKLSNFLRECGGKVVFLSVVFGDVE